MAFEALDHVYNSAFISGTGVNPSTDEKTRDAFESYIPAAHDALLEEWTTPDERSGMAIIDRTFDRGSEVFRMRHPSTAEFTEVDAQAIAKVRFLGHSILQVAARFAPEIDAEENRHLRYKEWFDAHPGIEINDERAHDPDCASPLRFEHWPSGDYVNCLGASIATGGQEVRHERSFLYINRLRSADYVWQQKNQHVFQALVQRCPKMVENIAFSYLVQYDESIESSIELANERLAQLEDSPGSIEIDPSFHHSVLTGVAKDSDDMLRQVDPYGLVNRYLTPHTAAKSAETLIHEHGSGRANELILFQGDVIEHSLEALMAVIGRLDDFSDRFFRALHGNYKSEIYLATLKEEFMRLRGLIWVQTLFFKGGEERKGRMLTGRERLHSIIPQKLEDDSHAALHWLLCLVGQRAQYTMRSQNDTETDAILDKVFDDAGKFRFSSMDSLEQAQAAVLALIDELERDMFKDIQYDSHSFNVFKETMEGMPGIFCFDQLLKTSVFNGPGSNDQAMEIAEPDFMVGAMYLNHYTRWQKDDTVNIAKELARVSPSQLIWQSAVARDPEALNDARVRAVGKMIKSLKYSQLHPFVRFTLPSMKE